MKILQFIRKFVRFWAGLFFWLNALLIISMPRPSLDALGLKIGLNPYETALVAFFIAMAVLSSYGFGKLLVDTLYIYAFPFILIYLLAKLLFKLLMHIPRLLSKFVPPPSEQADWRTILQMFNPSIALPATIEVAKQQEITLVPTTEASSQKSIRNSTHEKVNKFWEKIKLPFTSFTVLWGALIVLTDKSAILAVSLGIVFLHTLRFIFRLAAIAAGTNALFSGVEKRAFDYMESLIQKIMEKPLDEKVTDSNVIQAVTMLLAYRTCAFLLLKRAEITYAIVALGCFIYANVFLRLALLFGFIYIGVAKLRHIPLSFLDSMVNSLGMPLSYTFFPHDWVIQSVQLLHSIVVIALGAGFINAYFKRKLGSFRETAENVWSRLHEEQVKNRMYQFHSRFSKT